MSIGQELLNVPFPEMVLKLATSIAKGQYEMDMVSCKIATIMGDSKKSPVELPDLTNGNKTITTSLIGAGFQPTFYQFTDTIIEVKIAITMTKSSEFSTSTEASVDVGCFSASVNASYSSKYSYSAEGSSLLRTKITPLPPNNFMQRILDMKAQQEQRKFELEMKKIELQNKKENAKVEKELAVEEAKTQKEIDEIKGKGKQEAAAPKA